MLDYDPLIETVWANNANHGVKVMITAPFMAVNGYAMYRIRTIENNVVPEAVGTCVVCRYETLERDWTMLDA